MAHQFAKASGLAGGARALADQFAAEFRDAGGVGEAISEALDPGLAKVCAAIATGDGVKAYIVSGGVVLSDTYKRLGVDAGDLQASFGRIIAASNGNAGGATPGAQLLALLSQGGSGTLRGFEVWARTTLYSER